MGWEQVGCAWTSLIKGRIGTKFGNHWDLKENENGHRMRRLAVYNQLQIDSDNI